MSTLPAPPRPSRARMVHFGLGAFHRAHQAIYAEAAGEGIVAVAPRSTSIVDSMRAQNCLYTVTDRVPGPLRPQVIGSIVEVLHMRADFGRVLDLVASPDVTVVTMTITEKAHHRRAGTFGLDVSAVAADLEAPEDVPGTVVGALARSLAERFRRGGAPLSVVSCDNMAANGRVVAGVVRDFVEASRWPDRARVLDWLTTSVAFPSSIVDRIVPATTPEDVMAVVAALGVRDAVPVLGEPYREWVLEDDFAADRPRWERGGATVVPDVTPYQLRKLRLLNGSHSAMAYLGAAAGCGTVAEVLATEWGERLVRGFCAEVARTLGEPQGSYVDALVERFTNPAMRHRLSQIGSDGSLKIAERWFDPLREIPAGSTPMLALALAGWVHATRPDNDFGMSDPAAEHLADCWQTERGVLPHPRRAGGALQHAGPAVVVARLLRAVGAPDLAERGDLVAAVADRLPALAAGRIEF